MKILILLLSASLVWGQQNKEDGAKLRNEFAAASKKLFLTAFYQEHEQALWGCISRKLPKADADPTMSAAVYVREIIKQCETVALNEATKVDPKGVVVFRDWSNLKAQLDLIDQKSKEKPEKPK